MKPRTRTSVIQSLTGHLLVQVRSSPLIECAFCGKVFEHPGLYTDAQIFAAYGRCLKPAR